MNWDVHEYTARSLRNGNFYTLTICGVGARYHIQFGDGRADFQTFMDRRGAAIMLLNWRRDPKYLVDRWR